MRKTWTFSGAWYSVDLTVPQPPVPVLIGLAALCDRTFACGVKDRGLTARKMRSTLVTRDHYGVTRFGNKIATAPEWTCAICGTHETAVHHP
jgi:hypothetical protein